MRNHKSITNRTIKFIKSINEHILMVQLNLIEFGTLLNLIYFSISQIEIKSVNEKN